MRSGGCSALQATIRPPDGTITIDHFFDDMRPPTEVELAAMETLPWDGEYLLRDRGSVSLWVAWRGWRRSPGST